MRSTKGLVRFWCGEDSSFLKHTQISCTCSHDVNFRVCLIAFCSTRHAWSLRMNIGLIAGYTVQMSSIRFIVGFGAARKTLVGTVTLVYCACQ